MAGNYDGVLPGYTLYVEMSGTMPAGASAVMDRCLCESSLGYRSVRAMKELDCAEVHGVRSGTFSDYQRFCQENGMRMEQAKPVRVLNGKEQLDFFRRQEADNRTEKQ